MSLHVISIWPTQFAVDDPAGMEAAVLAETERQRDESGVETEHQQETGHQVESAAAPANLANVESPATGVEGLTPNAQAPLADPATVAAAAAQAMGVPGLATDVLVESAAEFLGKLNGIVQVRTFPDLLNYSELMHLTFCLLSRSTGTYVQQCCSQPQPSMPCLRIHQASRSCPPGNGVRLASRSRSMLTTSTRATKPRSSRSTRNTIASWKRYRRLLS